MAYLFDGTVTPHTITPSASDTLDIEELYSAYKTWAHSGGGDKFAPVIRPEGGGNLPAYYWLNDDWIIVVPSGANPLQVTGNLYPETEGRSMFAGAARQIHLLRSLYTSLETVAVGSGVTAQDKTDIATASAIASRDAILSDATRIAGARIDAPISSRAEPGEGLTAGEKLVLESNATLLAAVNSMLAEMHRRQGLDPANPVTLDDPGGRITAAGIDIEVTTVAGVTTMTRQA